jgi:hypothetical protein
MKMGAVVASVHVEQPEQSRPLIDSERIPLVRRAAGFVAAYWLEPVEHIGVSVIIFDTREHAEAAVAYPMPPIPGASVLRVDVREVYAHTTA